MYLSKKTPLVAVDMGSHSVKVAQLAELNGGNFELVNFGMMPLEEGSIVEGRIKKPDQVSKILSSLIKAEKIKSKYVVTSVSGKAVFIKKLKVVQLAEEELSKKMTEEVEKLIPFNINEVALDFQILGPFNGNTGQENESEDSDGPMVEVLLVAVHRKIIEERTEVLLEAGLKPVIIDLDVLALMNAANLSNDLTAMGSIALIDLGDSFTHVNILQNGSIGYTKDIPIGGGYCSAMLMSKYKIPFEQIHQIKEGYLPESVKKEEALHLIKRVYKKILEEVKNSFENFSTISNSKVERILLSGGGCMTHGIEGFIGDFLKIPVEKLNPMQGVKIDPKKFNQEMINDWVGVSTVAMGLATRRFDHS